MSRSAERATPDDTPGGTGDIPGGTGDFVMPGRGSDPKMTPMRKPLVTPGLLRVSQACAVLGVHPDTLRKWADNGRVKCSRDAAGNRWFTRVELARIRGVLERPPPEAPTEALTVAELVPPSGPEIVGHSPPEAVPQVLRTVRAHDGSLRVLVEFTVAESLTAS